MDFMNNDPQKMFNMMEDKTGKIVSTNCRVDIASTIDNINVLVPKIYGDQKPKIHDLEKMMALNKLCYHFGWSPAAIALTATSLSSAYDYTR